MEDIKPSKLSYQNLCRINKDKKKTSFSHVKLLKMKDTKILIAKVVRKVIFKGLKFYIECFLTVVN